MRHVWLCLFMLLGWGTSSFAEGLWSGFRGPTGQGVADVTSAPLHWSETQHVRWKADVPGRGWSSPVVWRDVLWVTTAVEKMASEEEKAARLVGQREADQRQVASTISLRAVGLDRETGRRVRDVELFKIEDPEPIHLLNSFASPTPVIEDGRLYCHFGAFGTACLDTATGEVLWKRVLPLKHSVGPGSSPVLFEDLLVLVCDGTDVQYVVAVDKSNGKTVWKQDRPPMTGNEGEMHKAFSTPLIVNWQSQPQLVIPGAQWFVGHDARSGELLWSLNHGRGFSNVAAPVFADGVAYLITGFTKPELWAVPVSRRGTLATGDVLWEQTKQIPKKSSPVLIEESIYLISDNGVLSCIDINNGSLRWSKRLGGKFSASPIVAAGHVFVSSHEGVTTVFAANPDRYEPVAENQLDGQLMASPLALDGALYFRSDQHVYCIQEP